MKIILVRHGQKQKSNSADFVTRRSVALTEKGIQDVKEIGKHLGLRFPELFKERFVYTSPYVRCIQTAEILRNSLDCSELKVKSALQEFYAYNNYALSKEEMRDLTYKAYTNPDWISPQTNVSLKQSIYNFVDSLFEIANESKNKLALAVVHSGIVRACAYTLNMSLRPEDTKIANSSMAERTYSIFSIENNKLKVEEFDVSSF